MKISVVIPVFNEEKTILECLNSLADQKYSKFEIIVVDDGSTDNTLQIIKGFISRHKNTFLYRQHHLGAGVARNLGVKHSTGEILVFVDADMTFDKVFLRHLVDPIVSEKVKGTFSKEEYVQNWKNIWARCWNWNLGLPEKRRLSKNYPDTQKVFRAILKKDFEGAGGFDPGGYTDDWSLSEKLHFLAVAAPKARFYHHNPDTLSEVFSQSKWSAKRKYKAGLIGVFIALLRVSLFEALIIGVLKSILNRDLRFLVFKFFYNTGATIGIISFNVTKKGSK